MDEILTAESLIVAVIGIFFGLWYSDINVSAEQKTYRYLYGKKPKTPYIGLNLPKINDMYVGFKKILSLFVAQLIMAFIFLPNVIESIKLSIQVLDSQGIKRYFLFYSTVNTSYVFIWAILVAMTSYSLYLLWKIKRNINGCLYARKYIEKLNSEIF